MFFIKENFKKNLKEGNEGSKVGLISKSVCQFPSGKCVRLRKIEANLPMKKRLMEMGFLPNALIRIIKNNNAEPLILEIKSTRLAIGRKEADKISVIEDKT